MSESKVITAKFSIGPGSGFLGAHVLDRFGAPEMSQITISCAPPEIAEPRSGVVTYFLHRAHGPIHPDSLWPPTHVCLRRWNSALSEYRDGRDCLLRYVAGLPRTNNQIGIFLSAVGHFEHSVINTYLTIMAFAAFVRQLGHDNWKPFEAGDNSTADRVNKLYNVIKHFDDRFEMGQKLRLPSAYPAPLWVTDRGLKGHTTLIDGRELKADWRKRKNLGNVRHQDVEVTFDEFVVLLSELTENARLLAEESITSPSPASGP